MTSECKSHLSIHRYVVIRDKFSYFKSSNISIIKHITGEKYVKLIKNLKLIIFQFRKVFELEKSLVLP